MTAVNTRGYSPRLLDALAQFGMCVDDLPMHPPLDGRAAAQVLATTTPGRTTLITGPSGSGKSTLLREVAARARTHGRLVVNAADMLMSTRVRRTRVIDLFPMLGSTNAVLAALARVGLGDATLLARVPSQLSDGQRFRLSLALAIEQARTIARDDALVICDEFTSVLDRPSARALGATLSRCGGDARHAAGLLLATAHDDVAGFMSVHALVRVGTDHAVSITHPHAAPRPLRVQIEPGFYRDYRTLSHLHYRADRPAMLAPGARGLLVARVAVCREPAGVLLVSMPTLNGRWRDLAWPGRYSGCKHRVARRINRELRTIARVIVDPRFRGAGVARRLIRAYLDEPLTPATEAVAAMGAACPMFARAGMTEYRLPPSARDARLLDALTSRGLTACDLLFTQAACALIASDALLTRELRRWTRASRSTRALRHMHQQIRAAAGALGTTQVAYAHAAA